MELLKNLIQISFSQNQKFEGITIDESSFHTLAILC